MAVTKSAYAIFHAPLPKGPGGQFSYHVPFSNLVPAYGKNQKAAGKWLAYLGTSDVFDQAVARFAAAYADQNERDHAALAAAVKRGRIAAEPGL